MLNGPSTLHPDRPSHLFTEFRFCLIDYIFVILLKCLTIKVASTNESAKLQCTSTNCFEIVEMRKKGWVSTLLVEPRKIVELATRHFTRQFHCAKVEILLISKSLGEYQMDCEYL